MIIGALTSGALVEATSMTFLLALPAIVVTVVFFVIWFGIEDTPGHRRPAASTSAASALLTASLGLVMGGLVAIRLDGPGSLLAWALIVLGLVDALLPFTRYELAQDQPMVDVRLLRAPGQWPVQLTAFLFGMSVLGAQIPLSTFARTDPDVAGYGLGADASFVSTLIGVYVIFLAIGAFTLPLTDPALGPRSALVASSLLVARRLRAVAAVPRPHLAGADQHGGRRPRLGRPGRRPARDRRRGRPAGAHRLRHRHDQRDQDHRRRDRLRGLRDRAVRHRLPRRPGGGPRRRCRATSRCGRSARSPPCSPPCALLMLPKHVAEEPGARARRCVP